MVCEGDNKMGLVKSWSISAFHRWEECPLRYKLEKIDRLRAPQSLPLYRGTEVHRLVEEYIRGILPAKFPTAWPPPYIAEVNKAGFPSMEFPKALSNFEDMIKGARKDYRKKKLAPYIELEHCFTKGWEPTRWDNWTRGWFRLKADFGKFISDGTALVAYDWKSGKYRESDIEKYDEQLELTALASLLRFPHVVEVQGHLIYLDTGDTYEGSIYNQSQVPELKRKWENKVAKLFNATTFPARANQFCAWCPFNAAKSPELFGKKTCKY